MTGDDTISDENSFENSDENSSVTPVASVAELFVLSQGLGKPFSYACPQALVHSAELQEGSLWLVPFGSREVHAVLWRVQARGTYPPALRLKSLSPTMRLPLPPLSADFRAFLQKFAAYTMTRHGSVLKSVFSPLLKAGKLQRTIEPRAFQLNEQGKQEIARTRARATDRAQKTQKKETQKDRLLGWLSQHAPCLRTTLLQSGFSSAVLRRCCTQGWVEEVAASSCAVASMDAAAVEQPVLRIARRKQPLSAEQSRAATDLCALYEQEKFHAALLDGETGSGKTEVYFEAIAACLQAGKQVLLMLPEIALSLRFAERFRQRFGIEPLLWHSALSEGTRRAVWHEVARGKTHAVLGARSALFLPFCNLGLVVIDEEHDHAYKQEDGIVYHARDMAVLRAQQASCLVVLVSATPSLESWHNAERGKYRRIPLPHRFAAASMPVVTLVDLLKESSMAGAASPFLTPTLCARIEKTLSRKEQVLVFLNRRGYAPLLLCTRCGTRLSCHFCNACLVEHRESRSLVCHHCDFSMQTPSACPSCGGEGALKACGIGIERLTEALQARFPHARLQSLSSDTPDPQAVVQAFEQRRCDLLVGTQMLAKGYHFPHLTLVGIVNADLGLNGGDPRAFERCYQLLHQVAGRAGRAEKKGEVVVQTTEPHSSALHALQTFDRDGFLRNEARLRCDTENKVFWPPFARLATVVVSAEEQRRLDIFAQRLYEDFLEMDFSSAPDLECFAPVPPPLSPLRGRHRRRFLLRTRHSPLQPLLARWLVRKLPADVRLKIDIDPYSFL